MSEDSKGHSINTFNGISILIVIGIVAIGLLAMGIKDNNITIEPASTDNTIAVNANIEMQVDPDLAIVSLGVSHLRPTAAEAQQAVNVAMNAIVGALESEGISQDNIESTNISLSEERKWIRDELETVGWRASQTIIIKTTDLSLAGTVIDVSVDNGANQINGVTFSLSEESEREYRNEALEQAGELAKEKAEAISQGLDVRLGSVKSVSESGFYYTPYPAQYDIKDDRENSTTVVIPGSVTVTATISVVYYLD
jgi:hypothetical protein